MKVALVTTTINVPRVLALYRAFGPDVMFFITGDRKTLDEQVVAFMDGLGPYAYYGIDYQHKLGWRCSTLLGENNDSRRNIAVLEALKWGAEIIVSVDDDMLPMDGGFFAAFEEIFSGSFSGLQIGVPNGWMNHSAYTIPPSVARGIPAPANLSNPAFEFVLNAKIGVAQGIILGVPDAVCLLGPKLLDDSCSTQTIDWGALGVSKIHSATDILRTGFVAHPHSYAVFNSQITAFRRELAPGFAQFYKYQQRNTDIVASVIMRRVMREHELYTYYGPPMGYHARTPRDLSKDYEAEKWGMSRIQMFVEWLDKLTLTGSAFDMFWHIYACMKDLGEDWRGTRETGLVWLTDCVEAMK